MARPASPNIAEVSSSRPRRRVGRAGTAARLTIGSTLIVLALVVWEAECWT